MKKGILFIVTAMIIACLTGPAMAATTTEHLEFSMTWDPLIDNWIAKSGLFTVKEVSNAFDLTSTGFKLSDTLTDAVMTVYVYDDLDFSAETFRVSLDTLTYNNLPITNWSTVLTPSVTSFDFYTDSTDNLSLLADGTLNFTVRYGNGSDPGDFFFDRAVLTFKADRTTSTVPVPAALILFGTGLLGLAGIRRKF